MSGKRNCFICEAFFISQTNQKYCEECRKDKNKIARYVYNNKLIDKNCIECGKLFKARGKQKLCEECYEKNRLEKMVHSYSTIVRGIFCKECGEKYDEEEVKLSYKTFPYKIYWRCPKCAEKYKNKKRKKISQRMLSDENPSVKRFGRLKNSCKVCGNKTAGARLYCDKRFCQDIKNQKIIKNIPNDAKRVRKPKVKKKRESKKEKKNIR